MATITVDHEGDEFEFSVETHQVCTECGLSIGPDSATVDRCPECGAGQLEARHVFHDYIKFVFPTDPSLSSVQEHADALRSHAALYEALEANGWELTRADGPHLYFEKPIESPENSYKIERNLE